MSRYLVNGEYLVHKGSVRIIAIMLFRLKMTVDEAILAYTCLSADVFKPIILQSQKSTASRLENAIAKAICSSLDLSEIEGPEIRMLDEEGPKWRAPPPLVEISF